MSSVKLRKEKDCLNCGRIVEEKFCPNCGQENIIVKENALHMVTHAIADYFHFEHKFFGTLKPLLFKPGQLTKEYVAGKRVKFIHPIRLYIFISIVFFLVVLSGTDRVKVKPDEKNTNITTSKTLEASKETLINPRNELTASQIKKIKEGLKYVPNVNGLRDSIVKKAISKESSGNIVDKKRPVFVVRKNKIYSNTFGSYDTTVLQYDKNQQALSKDKRDGFIEHYFVRRIIELNEDDNPTEKLLKDFLHNVPKMMFLLLPLFALILKLVYFNKKKYYYEHLIYSFHVHSAIFLGILVTLLLQWLFHFFYNINYLSGILCAVYIVWYIYRSLRTFYGSTRWITILKMFFLSFAYYIIVAISFLVVIAISFVMI